MTTLKEFFVTELTKRGMFEDQAAAVLEQAIPIVNSVIPDYKITWDGPTNNYPEVMLPLVYMVISEEALKWIDKNCPRAWFRPMFAHKEDNNE